MLDFACGSGRNTAALRRAGFDVISVGDREAESASTPAAEGCFAAAISTHGLLHGTRSAVARRLRAVGQSLEDGGWLYATFGSVRDSRCGKGTRIDDTTFAPIGGDESGVPHAFFDRMDLTAMLGDDFIIESLEERTAAAGPWAHRRRPLTGAVHWFAIARRRPRRMITGE